MSQLSNSYCSYYVKQLSLCTISLRFEMRVTARFEGKMCPKVITLPVNLKKTRTGFLKVTEHRILHRFQLFHLVPLFPQVCTFQTVAYRHNYACSDNGK